MAVRGLARRVRRISTAVEPGQPQLEQHQPRQEVAQPVAERAPGEQLVERLLAVASHPDPVALGELGQGPEQELGLERVVLDEEQVQLVRQHQAGGEPSVR